MKGRRWPECQHMSCEIRFKSLLCFPLQTSSGWSAPLTTTVQPTRSASTTSASAGKDTRCRRTRRSVSVRLFWSEMLALGLVSSASARCKPVLPLLLCIHTYSHEYSVISSPFIIDMQWKGGLVGAFLRKYKSQKTVHCYENKSVFLVPFSGAFVFV